MLYLKDLFLIASSRQTALSELVIQAVIQAALDNRGLARPHIKLDFYHSLRLDPEGAQPTFHTRDWQSSQPLVKILLT